MVTILYERLGDLSVVGAKSRNCHQTGHASRFVTPDQLSVMLSVIMRSYSCWVQFWWRGEPVGGAHGRGVRVLRCRGSGALAPTRPSRAHSRAALLNIEARVGASLHYKSLDTLSAGDLKPVSKIKGLP
ncbi:unnamed protein product [Colias eurytheme]|nr:unnamed protein product [Colias eurytheme]